MMKAGLKPQAARTTNTKDCASDFNLLGISAEDPYLRSRGAGRGPAVRRLDGFI